MALGAAASAFGFMAVVQEAKSERVGLQSRIAALEESIAQHETEKAQLANHANQAVEAASNQLAQAQQTVEQLKKDQVLLAQALPLTKPTGRNYVSWADAFSLPLGISLRLPPGTKTYTDERGFVALRASQATSSLPWLSISPYNPDQDLNLQNTIKNSEPVSYLVAGNLVTGIRGQRDGQSSGYTYVLRVSSPQSGASTYLIWAQTVPEISPNRIQDTLASLTFRS